MKTYKSTHFGPTKTYKKISDNGFVHFGNLQELAPYPEKITDKLKYWAGETPEAIFLANKIDGVWNELSYAATLQKVKQVAQFLIKLGFKEGESIVILSGNSVEHALLAFGALYVGIPYTSISPAYSLLSKDHEKLKHCLSLMTPKVVFAQNGNQFKEAITVSKELFDDLEIVTADGDIGLPFNKVLETIPSHKIEIANDKITGVSVAKVLFTSGSTGLPKGVINTHKMWCANLQQITQAFPFMESDESVFVDWLPWNHTFGGNHNLGLALYNGGSLFIDDGKPSEEGIETTVQNLREISPTAYFNVPKGFEMLIPYLEKEPDLRENFFKNLHIIFYAGASLPQSVWDKLEELSLKTIGVKIPIITGFGCTESGPSSMFANWPGAFSGLLGVPVAGLDVKLFPDGDKLEARYKAPNISPGYWRNPDATANAFDQDGYYKSKDAVKFLDENNPDKGLLFDGRIGENFKLSNGTWVNTADLKAKALSFSSSIIQDIVLTGLDQDFVGAILFLNVENCKKLLKEDALTQNQQIFSRKEIENYLEQWLSNFNKTATGVSTCIKKYAIAMEPPSINLGEITDKGSINDRNVLKNRPHLLKVIYDRANVI